MRFSRHVHLLVLGAMGSTVLEFDTTDGVARHIRLSVAGTSGFDRDGTFNQGVSAGEVAFAVGPVQVPEPVPGRDRSRFI